MRNPTKAWVVLADEDGPITGFELPSLIDWNGTLRREPIFFDISSRFYSKIPEDPMEFDLHLRNGGPFIQYTPRPDDDQSWTPTDRTEIEPPTKEISK